MLHIMAVKLYIDSHPKHAFVLVVVLGAIACVSIRSFFVRRLFARRHGCQPVSRCYNREPFLGLDRLPRTLRAVKQHRILRLCCELFRDYGNTFTEKELYSRIILTIEPENIKTVLSLNFQDYGISHRLEAFRPLLGEGIFDTDGEHWASSRALVRPSFTRDQVADLTTLETLIQDLFALLPRDGKTVVDLSDLFFLYTIDSATEFLFGESVGSLKKTHMHSEPALDFAQAFHYAQKAVLTRGMLGPLNLVYRDRKAEECNRICREFAQRFVDEAYQTVEVQREQKEETEEVNTKQRHKHIFSHELASRTTDRHRVLNELMNVLLAGRDTTASLLTNLFFMLAKNPAMWDKLRREVAGLQGRPPTYEELRNLRYVQCCMNECKKEALS